MTDYTEILSRSWDDIPEPKTLPVGSWRLRGRNAAFLPAKGEASPRVLFFYEAQEPMDDVDTVALDTLGADYDLAENDIVATFWVQRSKDWDAVRKHLALHGIETSGKSQKETFDAFKGSEVIAYLNEKSYTNDQGVTSVSNVPSNFAKAE